jgi:hypothetical protein
MFRRLLIKNHLIQKSLNTGAKHLTQHYRFASHGITSERTLIALFKY